MALRKFPSPSWTDVNPPSMGAVRYRCAYCDSIVAANRGWTDRNWIAKITLCPNCHHPTYHVQSRELKAQVPGVPFGGPVEYLPEDVAHLYDEARQCTTVGAYTAAVLLCRKLLMHVAVAQGAQPGTGFQEYVKYLDEEGWVPPNGKEWVDDIRAIGNEANHEIRVVSRDEAEDLMTFMEGLLRYMYEFPRRRKATDQSVPAVSSD